MSISKQTSLANPAVGRAQVNNLFRQLSETPSPYSTLANKLLSFVKIRNQIKFVEEVLLQCDFSVLGLFCVEFYKQYKFISGFEDSFLQFFLGITTLKTIARDRISLSYGLVEHDIPGTLQYYSVRKQKKEKVLCLFSNSTELFMQTLRHYSIVSIRLLLDSRTFMGIQDAKVADTFVHCNLSSVLLRSTRERKYYLNEVLDRHLNDLKESRLSLYSDPAAKQHLQADRFQMKAISKLMGNRVVSNQNPEIFKQCDIFLLQEFRKALVVDGSHAAKELIAMKLSPSTNMAGTIKLSYFKRQLFSINLWNSSFFNILRAVMQRLRPLYKWKKGQDGSPELDPMQNTLPFLFCEVALLGDLEALKLVEWICYSESNSKTTKGTTLPKTLVIPEYENFTSFYRVEANNGILLCVSLHGGSNKNQILQYLVSRTRWTSKKKADLSKSLTRHKLYKKTEYWVKELWEAIDAQITSRIADIDRNL